MRRVLLKWLVNELASALLAKGRCYLVRLRPVVGYPLEAEMWRERVRSSERECMRCLMLFMVFVPSELRGLTVWQYSLTLVMVFVHLAVVSLTLNVA